MTKKQLIMEWKRLDYELFENRPKTDKPYPPAIVERRELLLFAQVHLSEIEWAKKCRDKKAESYHTKMYYKIMQKYYAYDN